MKFSPAVFSFVLVAACGASACFAQDPAAREVRMAARLELERARLELQNYWQVELPRQRREINLEIELTEAEIQGLNDQILAFRPYTRFTIGEPFPLTVANLRVCRKSAELRLNNLQAERNALIRFHGNDFRLLQLKVQAARQRVADLEANDEAPAALPLSQG